MKKNKLVVLLFVFVSLHSISCGVVQRILPIVTGPEIIIAHTNDVHGNFRARKATWLKSEEDVWVGGSASLMGFVKELREENGETGILLFDGGDIFQGTPEGNETKGQLAIEIMNQLKYDFAALGNHEFDYGIPNLKELLALAEFPMMAENLKDETTGDVPVGLGRPRIIEIKGTKIGIFGLTTEDLNKVAVIDPKEGWTILPEVAVADTTARTLRDSGAEMVIMVSHCGLRNDSLTAFWLGEMAKEEPNGKYKNRPVIDLIVGGHSHTRLTEPEKVRGTYIVQAGSRGAGVGLIRLRWDQFKKKIARFEYEIADLYLDTYPEDPGMIAFLEPRFKDIDKKMNVVVGRAKGDIHKGQKHGHGQGRRLVLSTPLGNLQTDIMRAQTNAAIAFQNKGGMRAPIAAGEIRLRDLYAVSPFGNTIVTMHMSGEAVKNTIKASLMESKLGGGYTPLEISGLTVYYDHGRPMGDRLVNVFVNGKPLDDKKTYLVAVNSFLGGGGDAYPLFKEASHFKDTGKTMLGAMVEFFKGQPSGVAPDKEKRWKTVNDTN
ncbi:MAG: bifunctional metallophosphatase/5'-nucleotidase [Candidatus Lindowbacteria bacterium]|nr:bifunctional metallophosphatase/5'-nucleotidase [Candidatus Lindowbacteria bacterium]